MRNVIYGALCLLIFSAVEATEIMVIARGAYYYPTESRFRDIYNGGGVYGLETNVQLCCTDLYAFGGAGYFCSSGHSIVENNVASESLVASTKLQMVPLTVGLKYMFPFAVDCLCLRPYVGAGALFNYVKVDNNYVFVVEEWSRWGFGAVGKVGLIVDLNECWFVDLFADYSYVEVDMNKEHLNVIRNRVNLSGFSFGGGIGYSF